MDYEKSKKYPMIVADGKMSKVDILLITVKSILALTGNVTERSGKKDIICNGLIMFNR